MALTAQFRTEVIPEKAAFGLDPSRQVVFLGSCFADNIGAKATQGGWPVCVNPFGTVYNPESIAMLIDVALMPDESRHKSINHLITTREGHYVSWLASVLSSSPTPAECAAKVAAMADNLKEALAAADALIVTFGTADVWELTEKGIPVANCHKHSAAEFRKVRLSVSRITDRWKRLAECLRQINPGIKIIFTVSPRRYRGEGFADNSRLKAILLLACERLVETIPTTYYFPAYEIMMDDLRDYRFYDRDMLHPSPVAIDYIWTKFQQTFLNDEGCEVLRLGEKEWRRRQHVSLRDEGRGTRNQGQD